MFWRIAPFRVDHFSEATLGVGMQSENNNKTYFLLVKLEANLPNAFSPLNPFTPLLQFFGPVCSKQYVLLDFIASIFYDMVKDITQYTRFFFCFVLC